MKVQTHNEALAADQTVVPSQGRLVAYRQGSPEVYCGGRSINNVHGEQVAADVKSLWIVVDVHSEGPQVQCQVNYLLLRVKKCSQRYCAIAGGEHPKRPLTLDVPKHNGVRDAWNIWRRVDLHMERTRADPQHWLSFVRKDVLAVDKPVPAQDDRHAAFRQSVMDCDGAGSGRF